MGFELDNLQVSAGAFHLGPISLSVPAAEYLIVLGPSGAGKTVTLEAIAGLRKAASGRISMDGRDLTGAAPEARRIGFIYQDSLLFPHLSVRENLAYGARRLPAAQRRDVAARLAKLLQIEPLMDRTPRGLSGGERQRVALARALAANPILLLLDEPMAALDPNSRQELRDVLLRLHRNLGTTTIHVTHNFAEALALGDRVAILIQGKLLQVGKPPEVFVRPQSPTVAAFLKSARLGDENSHHEFGEFAPLLSPQHMSFRLAGNGPDASRFELEAEGSRIDMVPASEAQSDALAARITSVERDGSMLRVSMNAGFTVCTMLPADSHAASALVEGASILLRLPKEG
jgi:ABC-type sulfate/molybdate transport systems ATPase subunit